MPTRRPISDYDAQRVLRITLLSKVIEDRALHVYSANNYPQIKAALLDCFYALNAMPTVKSSESCDPPCMTCGAECVCIEDF
jgi:hypothetical protein